MGFSRILSATLYGLEVKMVQVEADIRSGLPSFQMVGYLSSEVKEAGDRVRTAILNSGMNLPPLKIVINLSPANLKKRGTFFDLPIALALLVSIGSIPKDALNHTMVIGELGLDGKVHKVNGILPIVLKAKEEGCHICVLPLENAKEASVIDGIRVLAVNSLKEICDILQSPLKQDSFFKMEQRPETMFSSNNKLDFKDIRGQQMAKRAAEIAVAGRHNLLFLGPPGAGKSMIAQRIPTILPEMSLEERIEVSKVYSVMGLLDENCPLIMERPFREVHHTITKSALIGGGSIPKPGEISLADKGVLFLDELAEFKKEVLEVLRQPLEQRMVKIIRSNGVYDFPADIMMVSAMNPCPCGYYPDLNHCKCTCNQIEQYLRKISQPFLSRVDLCIEVPKLTYDELKGEEGESSAEIRKRVARAYQIQKERYKDQPFPFNAGIIVSELDKYCKLDEEGEAIMRMSFDRLSLSARTCHRVLKVARTIADLDEEERIQVKHLQEALGYRMIDKRFWGGIH